MVRLPDTGHPGLRIAVRAGVLPPGRFVVLTTGRSGSVLLVRLLRSTPGVRCSREALGRRPLAARPWRRVHAHAARAALQGATAWGTTMHPEELLGQRVGDRRDWIGRLDDAGFRLVTLVRRNAVRAGMSAVLAQTRGTWHHQVDTAPPPVRLDPDEVLRTVLFVERKADEVRWMVGERAHLALTYEEGLRTAEAQQETVDRIRQYLGLPRAPVSGPALVRLSTPLREQVTNFREVVDLLATTHLADHLDEVR